jgi:sugar/nucleoside kinase (ribokinase family)
MKITGAGCCLYDYLYKDVSFETPIFRDFLSRTPGDGGLTPGELVFAESLASYKNLSVEFCLEQLTQGQEPDTVNLGGPALVSLIHSSQVLSSDWDIHFYSCLGDDSESAKLEKDVSRFPLIFHSDHSKGHSVPSTVVFSDPEWHGGSGERTFINTLGSALDFSPDMLDDSFFNSDICLWGGSGLVPPLHDSLGLLTRKVRENGGFNIVGTVYDFRNQAADPKGPWPLGTLEDPAYPWIDILITDKEEASRLSLEENVSDAAEFFISRGCGACIITQGKDSVYVKTGSERFLPILGKTFAVSKWVNKDLKKYPEKKGDTTGCGDNFMGGVLVSVAEQFAEEKSGTINLEESVIEGICAGGFALYQIGGVYTEAEKGEKKVKIDEIKSHYLEQIS